MKKYLVCAVSDEGEMTLAIPCDTKRKAVSLAVKTFVTIGKDDLDDDGKPIEYNGKKELRKLIKIVGAASGFHFNVQVLEREKNGQYRPVQYSTWRRRTYDE